MFKLCVIGEPIYHSKSPFIHQKFAEYFGLELVYHVQMADENYFPRLITQLHKFGYIGANITAPFKTQAYQMTATNCTERSYLSASVNTLILKEGKTYGDSTDAEGFFRASRYDFSNKKVILVGSGGVARTLIASLLEQQANVIVLTSSELTCTRQKLSHFQVQVTDTISECDVMIDCSPVQNKAFYPYASQVFDLKYTTNIKHQAYQNGLGMLVHQAALSFEIWTGKVVPLNLIDSIIDALHY